MSEERGMDGGRMRRVGDWLSGDWLRLRGSMKGGRVGGFGVSMSEERGRDVGLGKCIGWGYV